MRALRCPRANPYGSLHQKEEMLPARAAKLIRSSVGTDESRRPSWGNRRAKASKTPPRISGVLDRASRLRRHTLALELEPEHAAPGTTAAAREASRRTPRDAAAASAPRGLCNDGGRRQVGLTPGWRRPPDGASITKWDRPCVKLSRLRLLEPCSPEWPSFRLQLGTSDL